MGNTCFKSGDVNSEPERNNGRIETMIMPPTPPADELRVKLLLLGAGESGKTTLFKQMKINYVEDYKKTDLIEEKDRIIQAFFNSFLEFVQAILAQYGTLGNQDLDDGVDILRAEKEKKKKTILTANAQKLVHDVWDLPIAKETWENRANFAITDNLIYFLNDIDRIFSVNYEPTEDDYLKCRIQTTGIVEQSFVLRKVTILVVDVGGQRSERKKWIRCFDGVTAVLFVAAISEFDQKLFEDSSVDRMFEALDLFQKTLAFRVFRETPFVLFLNKIDLFREKIEKMHAKEADLDQYFPELHLGTDYENADDKIMDYIKQKFESIEGARGRVFTHFINATDKGAFKQVFNAAAQVVLSTSLNDHFQGPI